MKLKDYIVAAGLAAGGATIITFFLWLISLISWAIVWAGLIIVALPVCYHIVNEYRDSDAYDLLNFIEKKLEEKFGDNKTKNSEIEW